MFEISHNVGKVLEQVEARRREILSGVQRASAPTVWAKGAEGVARKALVKAGASAEQVEAFIATLRVSPLAGGFELRLTSPYAAQGVDLGAAQGAFAGAYGTGGKPGIQPGGLFNPWESMEVKNLERWLEAWVEAGERGEELGKELDARDWGKPPDEVARLLLYILTTPDPGEKAKEARPKLWGHVSAFIAHRMAQVASPTQVGPWLEAVLVAWRAWLRVAYPAKVVSYIGGKVRRDLASELKAAEARLAEKIAAQGADGPGAVWVSVADAGGGDRQGA